MSWKKLIFAVVCMGCVLAGCSGGENVTEQDARNFSKTPDGKDDGGIDAVNNNR